MTTVVPGFLDGGHWSACFGLSYRDLTLRDALGERRIVREGGSELRLVCGSGGIATGRNELARRFLDSTDGEWLWMVDTDMGFAPDTVDRLVETAAPDTAPVVGALCFCLRRESPGELHAERYLVQPTLYEYVETGDEVGFRAIGDYPRESVVQVSATGAACLLIHRSALAAVREHYGDEWFTPARHPTGDHGRPRVFSEDLSFCTRLGGVGLPLFVDTGIKTTHEKGGLFLDEETYAQQQVSAALLAAATEKREEAKD